MVYEVATITIKDGSQEGFESAVAKAAALFERARGCQSMRLERSIETPLRYRMIVGWATVEDHMIGFRNSADFKTWRELVADHFGGSPAVEHTEVVIQGF